MTLLHLRFLILKAQIDIRSSLQCKWCQTTVVYGVSQRLKCFITEILSARKGDFFEKCEFFGKSHIIIYSKSWILKFWITTITVKNPP